MNAELTAFTQQGLTEGIDVMERTVTIDTKSGHTLIVSDGVRQYSWRSVNGRWVQVGKEPSDDDQWFIDPWFDPNPHVLSVYQIVGGDIVGLWMIHQLPDGTFEQNSFMGTSEEPAPVFVPGFNFLSGPSPTVFYGVRSELTVDPGQAKPGGFSYKRAFSMRLQMVIPGDDRKIQDVLTPGMSGVDDQNVPCKIIRYEQAHNSVLYFFGSVNG